MKSLKKWWWRNVSRKYVKWSEYNAFRMNHFKFHRSHDRDTLDLIEDLNKRVWELEKEKKKK